MKRRGPRVVAQATGNYQIDAITLSEFGDFWLFAAIAALAR